MSTVGKAEVSGGWRQRNALGESQAPFRRTRNSTASNLELCRLTAKIKSAFDVAESRHLPATLTLCCNADAKRKSKAIAESEFTVGDDLRAAHRGVGFDDCLHECTLGGRVVNHEADSMQLSAAYSTRRPSALELLLERFAVDMRYVPQQARLIDDITELPVALERKAAGCGSDAVWRAWIHEGRIWFIIGRLSPWSVHRPERVLLHALFFDVGGELVSSGIWRREPSGQWTLCVA